MSSEAADGPPDEGPDGAAGGSFSAGHVEARSADRWIHRGVTAAIALLTGLLYGWHLGLVGFGNEYYAAAVRSATVSGKAMLFGAIDPGSFITVDKPPAAFWLMGLSGRIFGFSQTSMVVPEVLCGVGSVLLLHRLVRRWAGDVAAHLAAVALAVTPVAALMFRSNDPDALLTLLCIGAALALWTAVETGHTRWLVLSALLLGLAFDTKMLQAFLVVPALAGTYLLAGPPRLARRLEQLCAAALALFVAAGWWVALVALWPRAARPYVGSTTDNSIVSLIVGYNGLGRVLGSRARQARPSPGVGPLRLLGVAVAGQVSWLLPLAACGLVAGLWATRRRPRVDRERAGWLLCAGWLGGCGAVFSITKGVFHPYYVVQLAPAVAAMAGAGAVGLWRLGRANRWLGVALPLAVAGNAAWAVVLLHRTPSFAPWAHGVVVGVAAVGAVALGVTRLRPTRVRIAAAGLVALVGVLAGPFAYAVTTVEHPMTGSNIVAGPRPGGSRPTGSFGPADRADRRLVAFLEAHRGREPYLVAMFSALGSAPVIVDSGLPVVTMGGFVGEDPTPTLSQFRAMVLHHQVRYVLVPPATIPGERRRGPHGTWRPVPNPRHWSRSVRQVDRWVEAHGARVVGRGVGRGWFGTLYDLDRRPARRRPAHRRPVGRPRRTRL